MSIHIKEIESKNELNAFVRFPHSLYYDNPYWVPSLQSDEINTLRRDTNPAFEYCESKYWLAYKSNRIVGRIAGIINHRHIEIWKQRYLRFGWIDFIDDPEVTASLLDAVETWARKMKMEAVHGPLGFTNMDHSGMLVDGFDELSTMATIYNHPYYPEYLRANGYIKDVDWVEYELTVPSEPNPTIARIADLATRRYKLKVVDIQRKADIIPYARELFQLYNQAYKILYAAVPLSDAQIEASIQQYIGFIDPKFLPLVLDENDRMVAFGIAMPSLSKALQKAKGRLLPFGFIHILRALRKNDRGDLYLVAVRPDYQGRGVNAVLMHKMHRVFIDCGITKLESNPELETNLDVQGQWKYYDKRQHKRRRCFIKHLK